MNNLRGIATILVGGLGLYLLVITIPYVLMIVPMFFAGESFTASLDIIRDLGSIEVADFEAIKSSFRAGFRALFASVTIGSVAMGALGFALLAWRQKIAARWVAPRDCDSEQVASVSVVMRTMVGLLGLVLVVWNLSSLLALGITEGLISADEAAMTDVWTSLFCLAAGGLLLLRPNLLKRLWEPRISNTQDTDRPELES